MPVDAITDSLDVGGSPEGPRQGEQDSRRLSGIMIPAHLTRGVVGDSWTTQMGSRLQVGTRV